MSSSRVRSRLPLRDVILAGSLGLRARPLRAALSAVGIAIGVASVVSVLGISASSEVGLLNKLGQLGNLLEVTPTSGGLPGAPATLPKTAPNQIARVKGVIRVSATGTVNGATVRRTDHIPADINSGISVLTSRIDLLPVFNASMQQGTFLNQATERLPAVVLGGVAAKRLGINHIDRPTRVWIDNEWFTVVGILSPVTANPDLDTAALIGFPIAEELFGFDGSADTVYVRAIPDQVSTVRGALADAANPAHPDQVQVSRPSDVLAARAVAKGAFNTLLAALGGVALLVGGIGIANVMVISVLERRSEIGLRRALGATRLHIVMQFLAEAILLAAIGAVIGLAAGAAIVGVYSRAQGWAWAIPLSGITGALAAGLIIGGLAGLYPAIRAARMSPTEALRAA